MERRILLVLVIIYLAQIFSVESADSSLKSCLKKLQEKYLDITNGQPPSCVNKETLQTIVTKANTVKDLTKNLSPECETLNQQNISMCLREIVGIIADNEDSISEIMVQLMKLAMFSFNGCWGELIKVVKDYNEHMANGCANL